MYEYLIRCSRHIYIVRRQHKRLLLWSIIIFDIHAVYMVDSGNFCADNEWGLGPHNQRIAMSGNLVEEQLLPVNYSPDHWYAKRRGLSGGVWFYCIFVLNSQWRSQFSL
jgi:hypothetical protein